MDISSYERIKIDFHPKVPPLEKAKHYEDNKEQMDKDAKELLDKLNSESLKNDNKL